MKREYIVTLKSKNDLKFFYEDMETSGGSQYIPNREVELKDRRAISRNTHYLLTEEEAAEIRKDGRVLEVELTPKERGLNPTLFGSYIVSGNFDKTPDAGSDINWGILHCAGNQSQRGKGVFGQGQTEQVTDSVTVFNDGENVDIVIVDEPVAYDHQEFLDPDTNQTRFVQYQWYSELDQYMVSLDTQESDITYQNFINNNTDLPYYNCSQLDGYSLDHGTHVAGTAAGKVQGWARKSNIYSIAVDIGEVVQAIGQQNTMEDTKVFDYLRAFHLNKSVNPTTGKINPTVTNHSWGYSYQIVISDLSQLSTINYRGTTFNYNASTWNENYIESQFGFQILPYGSLKVILIPLRQTWLDVDVEDAIEDGVIVVSAAGNNYSFCSNDTNHQDYNNRVFFTRSGSQILQVNGTDYNNGDAYYNQGSSPGRTSGTINVGSISQYSDFRKADYSDYGNTIDILAPGSNILSSVPNSNSSFSYKSGTSMAAPQVTGIVACFCTNRDGREVNNSRALQYLQDMGIDEEITEDVYGGGVSDTTSLRDTPNLTAASRERREEYPILSFNDFPRKSEGVMYTRKKIGKKS